MKATLELTRLDQLRALADPLRLRIIDALTQHERSVAQLAKRLRVPPARLYHHIDLMLAAGVIEVARRVPRRGTEERLLRAVASDYSLDRRLFASPSDDGQSLPTLLAMASSVFATTADELAAGARTGAIDLGKPGRGLLLHDRLLPLTPATFAALARGLPGAVDAAAARRTTGRRTKYRVVLVAYPIDEAAVD